jgi:hypothetical protein
MRIGLGAWVIGVGLAGAAAAQEASVPLLATKFGELCTMCEAALSCAPADGGAPTSYAFRKKTFLGQMRTVLDFVPGIGKGPWESRPVVITAPGAAPRTETARLNLEAARIEAGGTTIDRLSGAWRAADGTALGQCRAVPPAPAPTEAR